MKKKVLKTAAIAVGMTFVFGTGVYAGSTLEQISAYLNKGVNLTWNGAPFYPQEDDGSRVYPITYNGRTYIPAKFIAEKAGLNVGWNGDTNTVSFTDENYVPSATGTYRKIGNGTVKFLTDDFADITNYGYDVDETLADSQAGIHNVKLRIIAGTAAEKKQVYIVYVNNMKSIITSKGWEITAEESLGNGHTKISAVYSGQPLMMELYSTDSEIVFNARRTDMGGTSTPVVNNTVSTYFDGYFSSVPKPNLDSSWSEEVQNPLKNWTVGSNVAYTFATQFRGDKDKIAPKAEEYKKILLDNGFKLYSTSNEHYTYIKGDIAIKIFAGYDNIHISLYSGYQAPHM